MAGRAVQPWLHAEPHGLGLRDAAKPCRWVNKERILQMPQWSAFSNPGNFGWLDKLNYGRGPVHRREAGSHRLSASSAFSGYWPPGRRKDDQTRVYCDTALIVSNSMRIFCLFVSSTAQLSHHLDHGSGPATSSAEHGHSCWSHQRRHTRTRLASKPTFHRGPPKHSQRNPEHG